MLGLVIFKESLNNILLPFYLLLNSFVLCSLYGKKVFTENLSLINENLIRENWTTYLLFMFTHTLFFMWKKEQVLADTLIRICFPSFLNNKNQTIFLEIN